MALIALLAPIARSTNRSTTAAPGPLVLLLYVISLAAPGLHSHERGPVRQEPGASQMRSRTLLTVGPGAPAVQTAS
jgi:hypothetical protein